MNHNKQPKEIMNTTKHTPMKIKLTREQVRYHAKSNETLVDKILDGLEASTDGRGFNAEHLAAVNLANSAPDLLAALQALVQVCDAYDNGQKLPNAIVAATNQARSALNKYLPVQERSFITDSEAIVAH